MEADCKREIEKKRVWQLMEERNASERQLIFRVVTQWTVQVTMLVLLRINLGRITEIIQSKRISLKSISKFLS